MGTRAGRGGGGQTNSGAARAGAPSRPSASTSSNAAGKKTYRDTASGKSYDAPKYGGASVKGLTSKDPANVARNRAGAAKYSSVKDRITSSTRDGNADKAAARAESRVARPSVNQSASAAAAARKVGVPPAAPRPAMTARPPAGYRPGIDPEYNFSAGAPAAAAAPRPTPAMTPRPAPTITRVNPTITLAKGGKAKGKKK